MLCNKDHPAFSKVKITEADAYKIELHTTLQHKCQTWYNEQRYCLTASKFGKIVERKTTNRTKFINSLISKAEIAWPCEMHKGSLKHGTAHEGDAAERYFEYMKDINHLVTIF